MGRCAKKANGGELVTNYICVTISVATGHRHDVGEEDAILV